jgi:hypothetical protein
VEPSLIPARRALTGARLFGMLLKTTFIIGKSWPAMRLPSAAILAVISVCLAYTLSCQNKADPSHLPRMPREHSIPGPTLEKRKKDLGDLIVEIEDGRTLNEKDVVARMGEPDWRGHTARPEDLRTTAQRSCDYHLPPGDYTLPNSPPITLGADGVAHFNFDGAAGPLAFVRVNDRERPGRLLFPSRDRHLYEH